MTVPNMLTWTNTCLGETTDLLTGFPFPSIKYTADKEGIALVRGDNVVQGKFRWDDVKRFPVSEIGELSQYFLKAGDVVIAMDRPWIEAGLKYACVSKEDLPCLLVQRVARLRARNGLDQGFLRYLIGTREFTNHILSVQTGTAVPHISSNQIREFSFRLPPTEEQRAIAQVLRTLDDKIELNQRMNDSLEALAQAMFKSWFVDFDAVRGKGEGRQRSLSHKTAALFPDSLQNSALGRIPKGWRVGTVGQDFNLVMGQSPPGTTYNESGEGVPFFQGRADFGFRYPSERVFCTAPTRFAEPDDTLVSVRAPVGDINLAPMKSAIGRGVSAIRHKSGSRSYTYYAMRSLRGHFVRFEAEGTVFGSMGKDGFLSIPILLPPSTVVVTFEQLLYPIDERIKTNEEQSRTLAELRDTLSPKLISGELRVKSEEKAVEMA
jgi:type I restriction enzyme, S subunit